MPIALQLSSFIPFLIFGGFAALFVFILVMSARAAKKRREAMQAVALRMGMDYQPEGRLPLNMATGEMSFFQRGHTRRFQNVLAGAVEGVEVVLGDYTYVSGSGKNRHSRLQTVVVFEGAWDWPRMEISPEGFFIKMATALGYQDLDFDDSPEFSRKYLVRGADELRIRQLLSPVLRQHLADKPGWTIQTSGKAMMICRESVVQKPEAIESFLTEAMAMQVAMMGNG